MTEPTNIPDLTVYSIEQLTEWFIKNRDWLAERKRAFEAETAQVEDTQDAIETELQRRLNESGATSMNTKAGQVVQATRTTFSAEDKTAFGNFIVTTGNWEATQIRPSSEFMREYQAQNDGALPPGVAAYSALTLSIKRPRAK